MNEIHIYLRILDMGHLNVLQLKTFKIRFSYSNGRWKNIQALRNMFSTQEKIWIVENFSTESSPVKVKRNFCKHYKIAGRRKVKLNVERFVEVIQHFRRNGSVKRKTPEKSAPKQRIETIKAQIVEQIREDPGFMAFSTPWSY